jgi:hypothetical protein
MHAHSSKYPAVDILIELLIDWVNSAFPREQTDYGWPRKIEIYGELNMIWMHLASALCGTNQASRGKFTQEEHSLLGTARTGEPPTEALRHRLIELVDAGLSEFFLVIAVRRALGDLIAPMAPEGLQVWEAMASARLPQDLQFAQRSGEFDIS